MLEKYHALNSHITVENIDPVSEPTRVTKYAGDVQLSEGSVIVTNGDESRVKLINRNDYYYYSTSNYTGSSYTYFTLESKMTSALVYVTSTETPRVFYLSGHNELDASSYCTLLTAQLQHRRDARGRRHRDHRRSPARSERRRVRRAARLAERGRPYALLDGL